MDSEMMRLRFSQLKTREDVAQLLEIKEISLRYFLYKRRPENMYRSFFIKKRDGGKREISAPIIQLKKIQQKLARILSQVYKPKICAFGFVDGRNILDNASQHIRRQYILNIDLKDFFSQCHFGRVRGLLMSKPYCLENEAATTIAQIACLNGKLPQGAPSSPILTNMLCASLDNALLRLAKTNDCIYTRYADDISISTYRKSFDNSIVYSDQNGVHLGNDIIHILRKNSFVVNPDKVFLQSKYARQEVTGLTVNQFPNVRRDYVRNIRAMLHGCEKYGLYAAAKTYIQKGFCKSTSILSIYNDEKHKDDVVSWFTRVIIGKIRYIGQIKGKTDMTYLSFAIQINRIANRNILSTDAFFRTENAICNNVLVVEWNGEDEGFVQGSGFYLDGYGFITSYHVTKNGSFFNVFFYDEYDTCAAFKIGKTLNEVYSDENIDFALYKFPMKKLRGQAYKIGNSRNLRIGDQVTIAGYPNHQRGNSVYIQTCTISSRKHLFGVDFYTVSGRIAHGASGGIVLDKENMVIGIIKGGIVDMDSDDTNENQGFVPLHLVIDFIHKSD